MPRSLTPPKGWKKGFASSRERDSASVTALVPVSLGPDVMDSPLPAEGPQRRLEDRRGTTTRLRDTVKMMQRGRV